MASSEGIPWHEQQVPIRWGHVVGGGIALILSAVLHVAALDRFPDLPVGRTPEIASYARTRPVTLKEVTREVTPMLSRPAAFRPEDPSKAVDLPQEAEAFVKALAPVIPEPQPEDARAFSAADQALVDAAPVRNRTSWEPRQDILKIEHQRLLSEIEQAPRRIVPEMPRAPMAPDILPPSSVPDAMLMARATPRVSDPAARSKPSSSPRAPVLPAVTFQPLDIDSGLASLEIDDPVVEAESEIAPFEPVEQLLDLKVSLFTARDEPEHTYFEIRIERKEGARMPVLPRDVLIMQDCSESMTQRKLNNCKEGLYAVLDSLAPEDKLEILTFREVAHRCFGDFLPADSRTRAKANYFIDGMEARGKTDVFASLEALMKMRREPGRPLISILITDGRPTTGLVDSSDIIEAFTRENQGLVSVFTLGGGTRVNRFLLDLLSYRNRGDARVEERRQDIPEALRAMAGELRRPVLADMRYQFSGLSGSDIFPETLTHLYLDRPLTLYGRFSGEPPTAAFQVVGESRDGEKDMVFRLDWGDVQAGGPDVRSQWAWHKIYHLIAAHIESGTDAPLDEAHLIADRYGLLVPYGRDVIYR